MSICAQLYMLFRVKPTAERIKEIEENIVSLLGHKPWTLNRYGGDEFGFLNSLDTDMLDFTQQGRMTKREYHRDYTGMPGPVSSERFYEISYLTRWWSEHYPEGPMQEYGKTMLYLLDQTDIEYVWFEADEFDQSDPMTSKEVKRMMKRAVEIADSQSSDSDTE